MKHINNFITPQLALNIFKLEKSIGNDHARVMFKSGNQYISVHPGDFTYLEDNGSSPNSINITNWFGDGRYVLEQEGDSKDITLEEVKRLIHETLKMLD